VRFVTRDGNPLASGFRQLLPIARWDGSRQEGSPISKPAYAKIAGGLQWAT
jgi:hypothetical protein